MEEKPEDLKEMFRHLESVILWQKSWRSAWKNKNSNGKMAAHQALGRMTRFIQLYEAKYGEVKPKVNENGETWA